MSLALHKVLEATGYISGEHPAPGVIIGSEVQSKRRGRRFSPDAMWRGPSSVTVYFKSATDEIDVETVAQWRQEVWNEGYSPLFWVISPQRVDLYSGYGKPTRENDAERHQIKTFKVIDDELRDLNDFAGRLAMETGQFWLHSDAKCTGTRVDQQLLSDLSQLERRLTADADSLTTEIAQALIGRCIFTKYLIDREILTTDFLIAHCGKESLQAALRDSKAAQKLFEKLKASFNGDMFPEASSIGIPTMGRELGLVADFLDGTDMATGQQSFFPYQFDVIPIELISSMYEQFAHSSTENKGSSLEPQAKKHGVHYTPLSIVNLILDEVFSNAWGNESVLDLTCGSGVFLVESLRRLVSIKSQGGSPSRACVRETLYNQVYGVDISEAAIRVAAFSLYLAAIELDPEPYPPEVLKFAPLIGKSLFVGDAHTIENSQHGASLCCGDEIRAFDIIVGNPPWTFKGKTGTAERRARRGKGIKTPVLPRGEGQDFVLRALDFSHPETRFGIVLDATPFFASSESGSNASQHIIERLSPATIINLSSLPWIFPTATKPAVVVLGRCRRPDTKDGNVTLVNVRWSPSGEKSKSFTISPNDIRTFHVNDWIERSELLKTKIYGHDRDLRLLTLLQSQTQQLGAWLSSIDTELRDGLILGKPAKRTRDASSLIGLDIIGSNDVTHFRINDNLDTFCHDKAEWPRTREIYKSPLVLIKEFFKGSPRPISSVASEDVVFTDAFFGTSLHGQDPRLAYLLSAILNSSFATWFFLMTSSEFGIWKRRLLKKEVEKLPIPDLTLALSTQPGKSILKLSRLLTEDPENEVLIAALDEAILDLYDLDEEDRVLIFDATLRAGWQWEGGRKTSATPATIDDDLNLYAASFLRELNKWLQVRNIRTMTAEIYDLPKHAPLRIIRFSLSESPHALPVSTTKPSVDVQRILDEISSRINLCLSSAVVGEREIRANGDHEVIMIKPSSKRFWMQSAAIKDVDDLIKESFQGRLQ